MSKSITIQYKSRIEYYFFSSNCQYNEILLKDIELSFLKIVFLPMKLIKWKTILVLMPIECMRREDTWNCMSTSELQCFWVFINTSWVICSCNYGPTGVSVLFDFFGYFQIFSKKNRRKMIRKLDFFMLASRLLASVGTTECYWMFVFMQSKSWTFVKQKSSNAYLKWVFGRVICRLFEKLNVCINHKYPYIFSYEYILDSDK